MLRAAPDHASRCGSGRRRDGVPLHAAGRDRAGVVQLVADHQLADPGLLDQVVPRWRGTTSGRATRWSTRHGRPAGDGDRRCCWARRRRSPCTASTSSAATACRSCWCCRSRCRASSPASRCSRRSSTWASRGRCGRWSSATRRSASWWSSTTRSPGCGGRGPRSRRRRWISAPTAGRRSATSRCPNIATALVAGGLLAFALSFDEIVVTLFTAGYAGDAAALDLQPVPAAEHAARGERGGGVRDPADGDPGAAGAAPDARQRRRHRPVAPPRSPGAC